LKAQIPWLRVFVEGVVVVGRLGCPASGSRRIPRTGRERAGELVRLAEELEG